MALDKRSGEVTVRLVPYRGALLGGAGVYIEGSDTSGNTVINFDRTTIDLLATQAGKGQGLRILSWRTLP